MYTDNPEFGGGANAWGLSGPDDLPLSSGFEKGIVRVSNRTAEKQAELYHAAVAAAENALSSEVVPDTVPDMDKLPDAPVSPAPDGAGSLALGETVKVVNAEVQGALV